MTFTTSSLSTPRAFLAEHLQDVKRPEYAVGRPTNDAMRCVLPDRNRAKGLADWQVKKITRHIDQNIRSNLKVVDLGALVHLSASHFSRSFKVSFGEPPYAYVLSRRVAIAMELIQKTDEPLSHIAGECGMCDQAHLCRSFRRVAGITPQEWRRHSRGRSSLDLPLSNRV